MSVINISFMIDSSLIGKEIIPPGVLSVINEMKASD